VSWRRRQQEGAARALGPGSTKRVAGSHCAAHKDQPAFRVLRSHPSQVSVLRRSPRSSHVVSPRWRRTRRLSALAIRRSLGAGNDPPSAVRAAPRRRVSKRSAQRERHSFPACAPSGRVTLWNLGGARSGLSTLLELAMSFCQGAGSRLPQLRQLLATCGHRIRRATRASRSGTRLPQSKCNVSRWTLLRVRRFISLPYCAHSSTRLCVVHCYSDAMQRLSLRQGGRDHT